MTQKNHQIGARRTRVFAAAIAGAAALLLGATSVQAQDDASTTPATRGAEPQTSTPFWGGGRYGEDRRDRRDRYDDDETFARNFPLDLAGQVAPARERFVALKYGYDLAQDRLGDRIAELRAGFEDSEEYRSVQQEIEQAQESIRSSREQALAPLMDDPQYRALLDLQAELEAQIRDEHRARNPDMEKIRGMSELAMAYTRQRREMETGLIGTDTTAQDRLRELMDRRNELEDEFSRELRGNEELAMLRDEIEQLRGAYYAAGAYYESVVRSANIAADFAYYNALARSGGASYGGFPSYGHYGYGYPYGGYGGYWGGRFGGVVIGGIPGTFPPGDGPIRLRPVIYPTPILSHTFRGLNAVPNLQPGAPGGQPPEIPPPEE